MFKNCYYHAVTKDSMESLEDIFKDKAIQSRRILYGTDKALKMPYNCNGIDFISLTKKPIEPISDEEKSLYAWIEWPMECISLMIDDRIEAIKTLCISDTFGEGKYPDGYNILTTSTKLRYGWFRDEWHVKDRINFNNLIGISYPLSLKIEKIKVSTFHRNTVLNDLRDLQKILIRNNINLPLYDLATMEQISLNSSIKTISKY